MKLALLFLFLFAVGCGHITATDNETSLLSKKLLIDVRTPLEFHKGHLKNAVNIPYNKIKEDIKYFAPDKQRTIVVYCASGGRANIAVKELKALGYKNVRNSGKYKDLKRIEEERN